MKCTECKSKAHIICGLNLDCPCCQKTLKEIWQQDEKSFKLLHNFIKRRKNVEKQTSPTNSRERQS